MRAAHAMEAPVASDPPATERVAVAGHTVMLERWGESGPAVLCLHGIPGWRGTWRAVGPLLGRAHRVVAQLVDDVLES